jgi:hypothetical protein
METMSNELLTIKFEGEALATRSLPIYELGSVLIALQRIVHKAALFADGTLEKGVHLPTRRREALALQIYDHRKGSDLWGFGPYLTDPGVGAILQQVIAAGVLAVSAYVWGKVKKKGSPPTNQVLIVNIFPEVKQLVDRIGNIGGVDRITIVQPGSKVRDPLVIDERTQEAVRSLEYQLVPGMKGVIAGVVTRLFPQSLRLDVRDAPDHYIRVSMDEALFERVRRLPVLMEREIRFVGTPLYRLGESSGAPFEFRAERVVVPRKKKHDY